MTHPPAPPLTPAEQDRVAAFEAAPVLAEAWDGWTPDGWDREDAHEDDR